ncbi:unnamed protein product [Prunus brigantina]
MKSSDGLDRKFILSRSDMVASPVAEELFAQANDSLAFIAYANLTSKGISIDESALCLTARDSTFETRWLDG